MPRRFTDHDLAKILVKQGHDVPVPPKPRKRPDNEESRHQQAFICWWSHACKSYDIPEFLLYAVPNGHRRDKITGAILKREGLRTGAPDLNLDVPIGKYHGLRIEMKAATGTPSDAQKEFIAALQARGYAAGCAYSYDDAVRFIQAYLRGDEFF